MSNWTMLDEKHLLCCRPAPQDVPDSYEFIQLNRYSGHGDGKPLFQVAHSTIHIHDDYTEHDVERILRIYGYSSLNDLSMARMADGTLENTTDPYQHLAELFFRYGSKNYVDNKVFNNMYDAVSYISSVTGLDLGQYLEQKLLLVTAYEQGEEVNFLTTREAFFDVFSGVKEQDLCQMSSAPGLPTGYHVEENADHPAFDLRSISLSAPESAAAHLSAFLSGSWNTGMPGTWRNAPERTHPAAKQLLSQLLTPVMDGACMPKDWYQPIRAVEWAKQHPEYVKNLDTIFSKLGLMDVQRIRFSVTQGEAAVLCCGKKIVQYGDDQWLQHDNGKISNGFQEREGRLYGEIISGWGSAKPDESFRRAALVQFTDQICSALMPAKTLDQTIQNAVKSKSNSEQALRQQAVPER